MVTKKAEIFFFGRVQGVGFRFTAERFANAHNLNGYVKNLFDGRVEVVVEGEEGSIKEFKEALNQNMDNYIDHYSINWFEPTGEFKRFEIRF